MSALIQTPQDEYIVPPIDPVIAQRMLVEADSWIGTKYVHQGKVKGLGVDCAQFVAAIVRSSGRKIQIAENYGREEDGVLLMATLAEYGDFVPTNQMAPADMIAFCHISQRQKDKPRHLALVREIVPRTTFIIHASALGIRRHRINTWWRDCIHSVWRLRPE